MQQASRKRSSQAPGRGVVGGWSVVLELTIISVALINQAAASTHEAQPPATGADLQAVGGQTGQPMGQHLRQHPDERQRRQLQKCTPLLNLALPQVRPTTSGQQTGLANGTSSGPVPLARTAGLPNQFTFSISDIALPLAQPGGTVSTAMKLLATLDSQLSLGGDEDEDDDDGNADAEHAQEDQSDNFGAPDNSIRFVRNQLHLSGLKLTALNVHLYQESEPKFALGLNIDNTTLAGRFYYNGAAPSLLSGSAIGDLNSRLAGHYRMSIDNVLVTASANLTKRCRPSLGPELAELAGERVSASSMSSGYALETNDFKINISNLGYISIDILDAKDSSRPTPNYMLKMLQRILQKTIKRAYNKFEAHISRTLELEGRRFLDCELTRFSPLLAENDPSKRPTNKSTDNDLLTVLEAAPALTSLDDLGRIVSNEIASSHLDRVSLPDFEYQRSVLGTQATILFANGSLAGLDHLKLIGETKVKLQDEHLIVNTSLGWFDLRPQYNWTLYLGGAAGAGGNNKSGPLQQEEQRRRDGPLDLGRHSKELEALTQTTPAPSAKTSKPPMAKGFVAFNIRAIDFDALVSKGLGAQTRLTVDKLTIRRLEGPKMDIDGLPGMNRLTRGVVNFFMGRLKQRLVSSIQPALKRELERVLNRLASDGSPEA